VSPPLVTIGIPTYNRARGYLREALASALAQTYERVEVVVADNCSEDDTAEVVAEVGAGRVRYHRHERNLGAQANFNSLLELAAGDHFVLLHDDDLIDADFVATCVAAMGERRPGLVRTGTRVIGEDGRVVYQRLNQAPGTDVRGLVEAWFANRTSFYLCSTMFDTAVLRGVGGFDTPRALFNDVAAYVRVAAAAGTVEVPDVKATFRMHQDSAGKAAKVRAWAEDAAYVVELMTDLVSPSAALPDTAFAARAREYFCGNCYHRASRIADPRARREAMAAVHEALGCTPPWRYELERLALRVRRRLGPRPA
jgi:glycosyltransferase involved in cell wall biosynthesis